jgi:hypothetical protein
MHLHVSDHNRYRSDQVLELQLQEVAAASAGELGATEQLLMVQVGC